MRARARRRSSAPPRPRDTCGCRAGHANPYHFHVDAACEYSPSALASASTVTAHSPLVGLALDGRGIYGAWESAGTAPTLDACGGHVGPTPGTASASFGGNILSTATATIGISGYAASTSVYHCARGAAREPAPARASPDASARASPQTT